MTRSVRFPRTASPESGARCHAASSRRGSPSTPFGVTSSGEFIGGFLYSSGLLGKGANDLGGSLPRGVRAGAPGPGRSGRVLIVFAASFATFYVIKKIYGLRVTESEEDAGLDIAEHGMRLPGAVHPSG